MWRGIAITRRLPRPTSEFSSGYLVDRGQLGCELFASNFSVVVGLHVDEEHVAQAESARQSQRGVRGDRALAVHDLVDAPGRYIDRFGDAVLRDSHRLE